LPLFDIAGVGTGFSPVAQTGAGKCTQTGNHGVALCPICVEFDGYGSKGFKTRFGQGSGLPKLEQLTFLLCFSVEYWMLLWGFSVSQELFPAASDLEMRFG
jgi:hypothetical protein